ncbi:hypothetical protein OG216_23080 [Streptomycetaceae bacterium NBC_01309]
MTDDIAATMTAKEAGPMLAHARGGDSWIPSAAEYRTMDEAIAPGWVFLRAWLSDFGFTDEQQALKARRLEHRESERISRLSVSSSSSGCGSSASSCSSCSSCGGGGCS